MEVISKKEKFLRSPWSRWIHLLAKEGRRSENSLDILSEYVEKKLGISARIDTISTESRSFEGLVVEYEGEIAVYPARRAEEYDLQRFEIWSSQPIERAWIPPAHIRAAKIGEWSRAVAEGQDLGPMFLRYYSPERISRFICTIKNSESSRKYAAPVLRAIESYWAGNFTASYAVLTPIVESMVREFREFVDLSPALNVRDLAAHALSSAWAKMQKHKYIVPRSQPGLPKFRTVTWFPPEFRSLEAHARLSYVALLTFMLREILVHRFYAHSSQVPDIYRNRHVFAHGLAPLSPTAIDSLRLINMIDQLSHVRGMLTDDGLDMYGMMDGSTCAWTKITHHEPFDPILALMQHQTNLEILGKKADQFRESVVTPLLDSIEEQDVAYRRALRKAVEAHQQKQTT